MLEIKDLCAGIDEKDSIQVVKKLKKLNVKSYMHYASEGNKSENDFNNNLKIIKDTITITNKDAALPFTVFTMRKVQLLENLNTCC